MFKLGSVFVINFNYLLNRIAEQEVVVRLILDLEVIGFEQKVLGGRAFDWSAFFAGYNRFGGWVNNLLEIWLVVGNQFLLPLTAIFDEVDQFNLVQLGALQSLRSLRL